MFHNCQPKARASVGVLIFLFLTETHESDDADRKVKCFLDKSLVIEHTASLIRQALRRSVPKFSLTGAAVDSFTTLNRRKFFQIVRDLCLCWLLLLWSVTRKHNGITPPWAIRSPTSSPRLITTMAARFRCLLCATRWNRFFLLVPPTTSSRI
jgi:hypothetical protein